MKILTQEEHQKYQKTLSDDGYPVVESRTITIQLCECGSGLYHDKMNKGELCCSICIKALNPEEIVSLTKGEIEWISRICKIKIEEAEENGFTLHGVNQLLAKLEGK